MAGIVTNMEAASMAKIGMEIPVILIAQLITLTEKGMLVSQALTS